MHPEKNDIDIYKLFHWGREFEITDRYQNHLVTVYMRLNGDAEINRARVFAIRKSKELRDRLKKEGSDDRVAFISTVEDLDNKQEVINLLTMINSRALVQEATKEVRIPLPKEPKSDASLEAQEKFQAEVDSYDTRRNEEVTKVVLQKMDNLKKELEEKTIEQLKKMYEKEMINELCEKEMITKFHECSAYFGAYSDPEFKQRMFNTFDEFDNLPTEIKNQYLEYYSLLEISPEELKKSQEATL